MEGECARACVHAHVSHSHMHVHLEGLCRWPDNGAKAQSLQAQRERQEGKKGTPLAASLQFWLHAWDRLTS